MKPARPSSYRKYPSINSSEKFSDEEMVRDWTLSSSDLKEIGRYRKQVRLYIAIQICGLRLHGRFIQRVNDLSFRIINYLNTQLNLPTNLAIKVTSRKATQSIHRKNILSYLGFKKFDEAIEKHLCYFLTEKANKGLLPDELFTQAQEYLFAQQILLPGHTVLDKLITNICSQVHLNLFEQVYRKLPNNLLKAIDNSLKLPKGQQRTLFFYLKEYPPSASITTLKSYLNKYTQLIEMGIDQIGDQLLDPSFQEYLYELTKKYRAKDLKRFSPHKRYSLMACFLLESRKKILDYIIQLHDQFIQDLVRKAKNTYKKQYKKRQTQQKKSMNNLLISVESLLDWAENSQISREKFLEQLNTKRLRNSYDAVSEFNQFTIKGSGRFILTRYPSLRKYFAQFIQLPFAAASGSESILTAISIIKKLDNGDLKQIPKDAPIGFVPTDLAPFLMNDQQRINRNAWETALAITIKNALRSGNLYLAQSKEHVSFWDLILSKNNWQETKAQAYLELEQPHDKDAKEILTNKFFIDVSQASRKFESNQFATIVDQRLKLKREDKLAEDPEIKPLQKIIDNSLPFIRIEELLMEVDQMTRFTQHFKPIAGHSGKPKQFYKTLIAAIISQATNLGIVSMSASMKNTSVDKLRHILHYFIREETLNAANTQLVNLHNQLPLSSVYGQGEISSSDAQRFKIRASSLLASYYPRYYGYYEKAIGIYTHVSNQYSVFGTNAISCGPREALYVLDGLLENNTILKIKAHTTDTHGFTEIIFALCHLLGYYFMPRIRNLKDQQLYKIDKTQDFGDFNPLLNKTVDMDIIEEQWDMMVRVASSLKKRTTPAHIIVQRLTSNAPSDRLTRAFVNLGRIIKTQYILRYITDPELRRTVQRQLNKGEYRHKLPRRVFFADQGEFKTGDYAEIMNKATCLSLVSNAVLYWNTVRINKIVEDLRARGEHIKDETLSHISLLSYKHVIPNGSYFIDDFQRAF
ncbi:Tn3 family transposase [Aureispira anguillae]|uniref:Tn3 family transposase n=1 Tax=Aureispira anguillae TaxID=2864201 RepID=A0A915YMJ3_9BACT|nr:Tn3 family transposase [Aureispira anguillae]BDS15697.1 Tn3 family transposase [Aureispira anguillae]